MRKLILLLLFWNFSGISLDAAFAGGVYIGNGGNVISCYQVEGLRFLDAYLAQTPEEAKKGPLSFVPIAHSPTEAATLLLEPLKILSPQRAVTYYSWLDHFFEEAILVNPLHARSALENFESFNIMVLSSLGAPVVFPKGEPIQNVGKFL